MEDFVFTLCCGLDGFMEDFVFTVAMLVHRCSSVSRIQFVKSSSSEGGKGESGVQLAEIVSLLPTHRSLGIWSRMEIRARACGRACIHQVTVEKDDSPCKTPFTLQPLIMWSVVTLDNFALHGHCLAAYISCCHAQHAC